MMTRSAYKLLFILLFVNQSGYAVFDTMSLSKVLAQYQIALQDLIIAHQQTLPNQPIDLSQNNLIVSTYFKLIAPSVRWITGYANLVNSQVAHRYPYFTNLTNLAIEYDQHSKDIATIVALFPAETQQAAFNMFYNALTASVVQTCYNIVSNLAYQSNFDDATMTAAYQAYQLAWGAQTSTMTIIGCASVADFQTNMTQNMETLFQAAIKNVNIQLAQGMTTGANSLGDFYKKLEGYYSVLSQVYTNSGDTSSAQEQQTLITQLKAQKQNYATAQADVASADTQAVSARSAIVLDVNAAFAASVQASITTLSSAAATYVIAAGLYTQANDLVGYSSATLKANLINENDILLRFIQQLWGMYLVDQSSVVGTFPELSGFVNQSNAATATSANAVQALTNLSGMLSSQDVQQNPVAGLFSSSTLQNLTIMAALQNVKNSAQAFCTNPNAAKIDSMLDLKLVSQVQNAVSILLDWCNSLIQAQGQVGQQTAAQQNLLAQAMADAKELDGLFKKHTNLNQYIPFLPNSLSTGSKTWQNFTAQFLVQTSLVTNVAQAMALLGTITTSTSGASSVSNITSLTTQATTALTNAQTAETARNFASASALYQQAMNLYTQLYELEPYENLSLQMLIAANLAKTKFVACSFAGIVQSSGSATFGALTKIPTSYVATSYQLAFDAGLATDTGTLMNGVVPSFLSSLTLNQPLTTLTVAQQQDLLAFIKGYLVAQYLADQGRTFTNYFTDYHMTLPMLQESQHASDAMAQISTYLNNFDSSNITSVTMTSQTAATLSLSNFPLSPVVPICSTLSSAGTYYSSAALLFAPGTSNVTFGGNTYVPGNDATSANVMLQNFGYAYLSQAQSEMAQVKTLMAQVLASLGSASSPLTQSIPTGFSDQFRKVKNLCISAQALLYGSSTTAYGYFTQAGLTSLANSAQQEYLKIYQQQIDFGKQCLVGDPTGNDYQYVVTSLNNIYVNWASELTDTTKIAQINTDIAKLYETAGQKALNFTYEQQEFPGVKQIHYMTAAQYYCSVQAQYNYLNNTAKVAALTTKLNQMYYDACSQNMALYFNVKTNGASYVSSTTNALVNISFDQLNSDIANYTGDPNESPLYTLVQNLLLNAAIIYEQLSNLDSTAAASAAQGTTNPDHTIVLTWLATQIDAITAITNFGSIPINLSEQIINLAPQAYTQFVVTVPNPAAFAAWNALLFSMVKNIYMMDYLGVTTVTTATALATDTTQFLTALQNDTLSLSNPSAGYVQ